MSEDTGNKVLINFIIICDSDKENYHNPGEYRAYCVHTGTLYCSECSEFCVWSARKKGEFWKTRKFRGDK